MKKLVSFWQCLFCFGGCYQNIKIPPLFFLRFALLILDLSPEVTTRGLLYKNLFLEILQYSQGNTVLE